METLLKNSTMEMLREYYYDERGEYPPNDFTREEIIQTILDSGKKTTVWHCGIHLKYFKKSLKTKVFKL